MQIVSLEEAKRLGLKHYFTGKPCKRGHIQQRLTSCRKCVDCQAEYYEERKEEWSAKGAEYRRQNPEKKRQRDRDYHYKNRDRVLEQKKEYWHRTRIEQLARKKEYRDKNKEKTRASIRRWESENKERVLASKLRYEKERRANDPIYAIKRRMRVAVSRFARAYGYEKSARTEAIIGCSWQEFRLHIERQFHNGMNWDNMDKWHIDHIVPMASAKTEEDVLRLNHFTNLRPLWAIDNLKKSNSAIFLL